MPTATSTPTDTRRPATGTRRVRRPRPPGGRLLLLASTITLVAAMLPWVDTQLGTFWGLDGPGRWTLYAGFVGLAGGLQHRPRLVAVHAGALAVVAILLPSWQLARLVEVCPAGGCLPAGGLLLTLLAGSMAVRATWLAARARIAPGEGSRTV